MNNYGNICKFNNRLVARVATIAALVVVMIILGCSSGVYAATVKTYKVSYPTIQTQRSFDMLGTVSSTAKIKKAKVGVINVLNGKWATSKTKAINAKSFKLSSFDEYLKFTDVKPGIYYYRCTVYYANGKYQRAFNKVFVVYSLKKTGVEIPKEVSLGESLTMSGTVDFKPFAENMSIEITDSNGNPVEGHTAEIEIAKSKINLSEITHEALKTENLETGEYKLRVKLKIRDFSIVLISRPFKVDNSVKTELKSVSMPKVLAPGKGHSVKGTVSCNAVMTSLKLGIKNKDNKWVSSKSVNPKKKSYNLSKLDDNIKFKDLGTGTYHYVCEVKAKGEEVTAFDSEFKVLTVTKSGIKYPTVLVSGGSFDVGGVIKSNPKMSSIKVGVKKDGEWVDDCYASSTKSLSSYDIGKNANDKIKFGSLKEGKYNYTCEVTILGMTKKVFDYEFEVTDKVSIKTSNVVKPPERLGVGKSFSIGGKLTSNVSMTRVRVGITDTNGSWKVYKDFTPKSKTFDIATADRYITFGSIPSGTYYYRIDVTAGSKSYTKIVNCRYEVAQLTTPILKATVSNRIEQLCENLDSKYFTTDGKKASSSIDNRCNVDNVLAKNKDVRKLIKTYKKDGYMPTSMSLLPLHYGHDYGTTLTRGWSCCGFANFAGWYIFADSCSDDVSTVTLKKKIACNYTTAKENCKPGDIIRITGSWSNGHSAIVIAVHKSGIEILDANSSYYDPVGDRHASRICTYTLGYSKIDYMSVSRATNSPYL